jgi:hypothetical protein
LARHCLTGDLIEPLLDALNEGVPMLSFQVKEKYYIETFGKYYVEQVSEVTGTELSLTKAAWVANTGKYSEFLKTGKAENMEVEPIGEMSLPLAYVSFKKVWKHNLFDKAI